LIRRVARLDMRARIDFDSATWNEGLLTLTSTGSFTGMTQLAGDEVEITGGTDVKEQFYRVASKTNNTLVLTESLQTTGGTASDISGTLLLDSCLLPTDLREIVAVQATNGLVSNVKPTTLQKILDLRTREINLLARDFVFAVVWHPQTDGTLRALLELYPEPTTEQLDGISLYYRAGFSRVDADTEIIPMPVWMEQVFLLIVRATARGYEEGEEEDSASIHARLAEIQAGPLMQAAMRTDGSMLPDVGPVSGGAAQRFIFDSPYLRTTVPLPS
ncbi:MAG TPA: hypothetical protein VF653_10695, partial [Methylomirabilota bacterium]